MAVVGDLGERHPQPFRRRELLRVRRRAGAPQVVRLDADHPLQFAAKDNGPTPVEYVLVGLGACLTAGVAAVAQQRQIQLRSVKATLSADMDLHGILGADPDVRNGFSGVPVDYQIDADATPDEIRAIVAQSQKRSAVFDIVTNPTDVTVTVV